MKKIHEYTRVSKGIYRYEGLKKTTYVCRICRKGNKYSESFGSLKEAREWHASQDKKPTGKIGRPRVGWRAYITFQKTVGKHGAFRVSEWNGSDFVSSKQFGVSGRTTEERKKAETTARSFLKNLKTLKESA
jgi:hypothetical protein